MNPSILPKPKSIDTLSAVWWRWGMLVVLLAAAWLRLASLPELPVGLHYDEAANLILTRQIVEGSYRPLFIRAYTGKEVLFFYAAAPWVWMTGGAAWGLRLGAAMQGILTVAATFAATLALVGRQKGGQAIALFAAAWLAVAFPHLLLSRYGFRAISQPLLQALTVAALWRGLRSGKTRWLLAAGAFLGLTAYTYLAARLFPIPLGLAIGWLLARSRSRARRRLLVRLLVVPAVAVIVIAPLGVFFLRTPEAFTTRIAQVLAPTWTEALRGVVVCLRALVWPGGGDAYVRFNRPGLPMLDLVSALLALVGLISVVCARRKGAYEAAARVLVVAGVGVMILPSALATGEITPSNLRMVGLWPFLAVLPAWGAWALLSPLKGALDGAGRPARWPFCVAMLALLVMGAARSGRLYATWAGSDALFRESDGEMVVAAQVLDAVATREGVTVYVAGEHYRHPTVAALALHYKDAKWLTGGASLVLPAHGDAVILIPESLQPPASWPAIVTEAWASTIYRSPAGTPTLVAHSLPAATVADVRAQLLDGLGDTEGVADFAHVVQVHDAAPVEPCRVAEPCTVRVIWEPLAPYISLQPVVRLLHPESGEWARTMAFHYPPEEWTPGELVLDYLVLIPPVGLPPVTGYQIGVGFYDPSRDEALPRLEEERFAGFEAIYPAAPHGLRISPMLVPPTPEPAHAVCPGVSRGSPTSRSGLALLGWTVHRQTPGMSGEELLPGSELSVRICWQATAEAPPFDTVKLVARGASGEVLLYEGLPANGYGFSAWREGEALDDRYRVRLPRSLRSGDYDLWLQMGAAEPVALTTLRIGSVDRTFVPPDMAHMKELHFDDAAGVQMRLLGYDLSAWDPTQPWSVTLAWQAAAEMSQDYVVFLHLRETESNALVAQVDEMPRKGSYPTSLWMRNEVVSDAHTLTLPASLSPGSYTLYVGLYLPTGTHLLVSGAHSVPLAEIRHLPSSP